MSKIVIIGGGAAGLLCAAKSAEKGNDVVIIEKMNRCGRKLMITGKGQIANQALCKSWQYGCNTYKACNGRACA